MWQPISSGETSREYWSIITDIEVSLTAHLARQAEDEWAAPHVSGGAAGISLFFAYLHAAGGSAVAADRALEALELSTGALPRRHLLPSLYSGFVGVGWVISHLTRELFEGDDELVLEVDEALRQLLSEVTEKPPFELLSGVAGYGIYLLERLPNPGAEELLSRIVELLDVSRDETGTWYSNPDWLPEWQRELMPRGCHNLGVAHGIPGVIGFLAAAQRAGLRDSRVPRLADDAVRWLLRQKGTWPSSLFPAHVPPDADPRPTRTAWCYGDIGVSAVLLSAARSFGRLDWEEEALAIARTAARRSVEETKVTDVGLCHGASGIAHLFNRLYQATGEDELRDAAAAWYRLVPAMRRPGEGIAGFIGWADGRRPGEGEWRGEPGFLSGVAGIGLTLLAAVSEVEPAWDRVMVVSVPPRNGAVAS
jgi:lantibiotic modifying enzyme